MLKYEHLWPKIRRKLLHLKGNQLRPTSIKKSACNQSKQEHQYLISIVVNSLH